VSPHPDAGKQTVHPLSKQVYRLTEDGLVEVTDPRTGRTGIYDAHGVWRSGARLDVDIQLAGWVGRLALRKARP
jgi:hypothetical protein